MSYDQCTELKEPVEIRAHHLFALGNFMLRGSSVGASIAAFGPNAETNNFNGYGRAFVVNEVQTWLYLMRNQRTRVKITDRFDVLCHECGYLERCSDGAEPWADEDAANVLGVEIGKEYTVKEIMRLVADAKSRTTDL